MSTLAPVPASNGFVPIGLDEITAEAALQTRVERKYLMPCAELDSVLGGLDARTRVLEIGQLRSFAYETVYFDTPWLMSYRQAAHQRRRRIKVRTRSYLDNEECWLEAKTRGVRSITAKDRLTYRIEDRRILTDDGRRFVDDALHETGIDDPSGLPLAPSLTTRYRRTTLYLPGSASRATIDVDLFWEGPDGRAVEAPRLAVIETKSGSAASMLDRMLWADGIRPATISKYAVGMAVLHPELPANKWARALKRHFEHSAHRSTPAAAGTADRDAPSGPG